MSNIFYTVLFAIFSLSFNTHAQVLANNTYSSTIKTVLCHKKGWSLSYPIIRLGSSEKIQLTFDDLTEDTRNYTYSIIHCDRNWEPSLINEADYIDGINQVQVLDYEFSFNTTINYIHYAIELPNQDIQLRYSGNYIIKVYEDFDKEHPVLTRKFMVIEPKVGVRPQIKFTMNAEIRKAYQEVDFTIDHPNFEINNPLEDVKVSIFQNGRLDNAIYNLKPQFIKQGSLIYNYNKELIFEGGNEFRWLDIRSVRYQSARVKDIVYHEPFYHVEMFPDNIITDASYFFRNDFNGKYVIENRENRDPEIESEYVMVHFSIPRQDPFFEGDVFLLGEFTDWQFTNASKMRYNPSFKNYETTILLKQGFYNYQYALKKTQSDEASVMRIEGSYSETENDYLILVYYRSIADQYDRLIGVAQTNSIKP